MKLRTLITMALTGVITITVAAQNVKKYHVAKPGTLVELLTEAEANVISDLTLTGKLNAVDFRHLRDEFLNLQRLDISNASISNYIGSDGTYTGQFYVYPSNTLPPFAFCLLTPQGTLTGKSTLTHIVLGEKTRTIGQAAFKGCPNLRICQIRRKTPPTLEADALDASTTALFVPVGCSDTYRQRKGWEPFACIEAEPLGIYVRTDRRRSLPTEIQKLGKQPGDVHFLTIEGALTEADFALIRDYMPHLVVADLSRARATALPDYTFTQKKLLLQVFLPQNLKQIGQRAFSGCIRLSGTLLLPQGITAIGYGAFMGCDRLQRVQAMGRSLTTIGDKLFGEEESRLVY